MRLTINIEHTFEDPSAFMNFAAGFDDLYNKYFSSVPGSVTARPPAPSNRAKLAAPAHTVPPDVAPSAPLAGLAPVLPGREVYEPQPWPNSPEDRQAVVADEQPPATRSAANDLPKSAAEALEGTALTENTADVAAPARRKRVGRPKANPVPAVEAQPQLPVAGGFGGPATTSAPVQGAAPTLPPPADTVPGEPATLDACRLLFSRVMNFAAAAPIIQETLSELKIQFVRDVKPEQYGAMYAGLRKAAIACGINPDGKASDDAKAA